MTELPDVPDNLDEPLRLQSGEIVEPELLEIIREVNRDYIAALDDGAEPRPPVEGERYLAAGVFPRDLPREAWRNMRSVPLLALAIAHVDDEGCLVVDLLMRDTTEAAAEPALQRYGLFRTAGNEEVDEVDCPLVQAVRCALKLLRKPPPIWCRSWRHGLAFERVLEINDTLQKKWSACWEGGVQVRELLFDGALVEELVKKAIEHHYDDDLDEADRHCEEAESAMLGRRP